MASGKTLGKSLWLRIPVSLLVLGDMALLAMCLRPWPEVANLPGQGTTGYDPAICLIAYFFLLLWFAGTRQEDMRKALWAGVLFALPAGLLCIGFVCTSGEQTQQVFYARIALLVAASILWGFAGVRGTKLAHSPNVGIAIGVWSAMLSALLAVAAILAQINLHAAQLSSDPWKQYQGLAIGSPAVQTLVHSLTMASGFLLIAPLVGGILAMVFSFFVKD